MKGVLLPTNRASEALELSVYLRLILITLETYSYFDCVRRSLPNDTRCRYELH
jgi:hypothetical protein